MVDFALPLYVPQDKRYWIYLSFILHGIGISMPWNMLIIAEPYITEYKLGPQYLDGEEYYATTYLQYVTVAAQVSNMIFNWINIFIQLRDKTTTRIVCSIAIQVVIIILTVSLTVSDTQKWPGTFFWVTMISILLLIMANGIYQNTIFGMAAKFPMKYTSAVILGSNINGIFATVVAILSKTFELNILLTAIYYFIIALFILLLCLSNYLALPLNNYYRDYQLKEETEAAMKNQSNSHNTNVPYFHILRKALPQLFNIFFVSFVTSSIFPAIQAKVKLSDPDFLIPNQLYTSVTCYLTHNIAASVGCYLTVFGTWPSRKYLVIPVVAHVMLIPFFLFSNYHISDNLNLRMMPIFITNDWVYWIISIIMGVSSGHLSSLGMMYVSRTVKKNHACVAGMFGSAALATGCFGGILLSFIWPAVIYNFQF